MTSKHVGSSLIELKPDEADILSFVAANAKAPSAKPHLLKALSTSTKRAQAIGNIILGDPKTHKASYLFMAKRFADASARNLKDARALRFSPTPPQTIHLD